MSQRSEVQSTPPSAHRPPAAPRSSAGQRHRPAAEITAVATGAATTAARSSASEATANAIQTAAQKQEGTASTRKPGSHSGSVRDRKRKKEKAEQALEEERRLDSSDPAGYWRKEERLGLAAVVGNFVYGELVAQVLH